MNSSQRSIKAAVCLFLAYAGVWGTATEMLGNACDERVFDDGTISNAFYFDDTLAVMARKFEGSFSPVGMEWGEVNTISLGDPFYPWPDSTYDPIEVTM